MGYAIQIKIRSQNIMARIYDPIPISEIPPEFANVVRRYKIRGLEISAYAEPMPTPPQEWINEQIEFFEQAAGAWERLHTWKKVRWSICAINTYGDPDTLSGAPGYSGKSLYIKCWLEQKPEANKQPISPCSARVTDPDASPWNYQP